MGAPPPATSPVISNVSIQKKDLIVSGNNFDAGSAILLDQQPVKTLFADAMDLTGTKAAKLISPGQTVIVQVKDSRGAVSPPFNFTRPGG